jgi:hypothetical protein
MRSSATSDKGRAYGWLLQTRSLALQNRRQVELFSAVLEVFRAQSALMPRAPLVMEANDGVTRRRLGCSCLSISDWGSSTVAPESDYLASVAPRAGWRAVVILPWRAFSAAIYISENVGNG